MIPSLAVMSVVLLYPLGSAVYFSFLQYYLGGGPTVFVGLRNYTELLADARFWGDLLNTVIIVGCSVALQLAVGLALALALYALHRGVRLISLLNFLPNVVTPVVGAIFLKWMFVGRFGLLYSPLISLDIFPPDLLGDPLAVAMALGGRELAAILGATLAARHQGIPVLLDGFICTAAAAPLAKVCAGGLDHTVLAHVSAEAGHRGLAEALCLRPLFNLGMRLGEGSAAALAVSVLRAALACLTGMATFAEAAVDNRD